MNYNDEIISFFTTTLPGWDVTGHHSRSLFIIKNRHNFGHNLHAGLFCVADWIGSDEINFLLSASTSIPISISIHRPYGCFI